MNLIKKIGLPATLELLAEECAELSHAALKYARYLRNENPTPVTEEQAIDHLAEEMADVNIVLKRALGIGRPEDTRLFELYASWSAKKTDRLHERLGD